jgi:hypothetical protein
MVKSYVSHEIILNDLRLETYKHCAKRKCKQCK